MVLIEFYLRKYYENAIG